MSENTIELVVMRHAESEWNSEGRFTGWEDIPLSEKGLIVSKQVAMEFKERGMHFDVGYASFLQRSIKTLWIILEEMGISYLPTCKTWRLNERMYGDLQGREKSATIEQFGEKQVKLWRRSYSVRPPSLSTEDERWPGRDSKYKSLSLDQIPSSECLEDVVKRMRLLWEEEMVPQIREGRRLLIVAHGSNVRALRKIIEDLPDEEIATFEVPNGIPMVFKLNRDTLKPVHQFFLDEKVGIVNENEIGPKSAL
eukprot:TRINITY_DN3453_c1_g1_i1.p1 TRINITY_DN3453_c1_g1~~TRINITY_DN3453_c1_g1_i1.p1  ORF type:complete len:252 (-),score=96.73 TRINITY_DN3453_c1_g1_i1:233-988(-)